MSESACEVVNLCQPLSSLYPFVAEPEDYLCFIGRIDPVKQPDVAIELAIQTGMHIKVAGGIGGWEAEQYFESKVKPLLKHPLAEFLGEVGWEDKIRLISNASCNLHPTGFREPFGLSVLEAGYCGTPTLAINRGALPETILDGKTGVLVEDFAEGCGRLGDCLTLNRRAISESFRQRFSQRQMALNYLRVYERLLAQEPMEPSPDEPLRLTI
jgi:glycosyltransferase involved in cell wall biosynthesis